MTLRCLLIVSFFALSCRTDKDEYVVYTIEQGKHNSTNKMATFSGSELKFEAIFTHDTQVFSDFVNKLYGFSDCSSPHHRNSARFGWKYNGELLEIWTYSYSEGVREHVLLGYMKPGEKGFFSIKTEGSSYIFNFNGKEHKTERKCSNRGGVKYMLFPYWGGNPKSPTSMSIKIKELS